MTGMALWITGLPGSGKSTIANELKKLHPEFVLLRMDEMRKIVTPEPSYSDAERDLVYRSIVFLALKLVETGHNVIIDATGNKRAWRELARRLIPRYAELYLRCSPPECRSRDEERHDTRGAPSDIYKKGDKGWPVPGMNAPYEAPEKPELEIDTDSTPVKETVKSIEAYLKKHLPQPRTNK
jgi:adenylylsulfate kinase